MLDYGFCRVFFAFIPGGRATSPGRVREAVPETGLDVTRAWTPGGSEEGSRGLGLWGFGGLGFRV